MEQGNGKVIAAVPTEGFLYDFKANDDMRGVLFLSRKVLFPSEEVDYQD